MLSLVDKDQFNANNLSNQLKLMKKANPPPKLHEHKIFDKSKKKKKCDCKKKKKKKCRKKKKCH